MRKVYKYEMNYAISATTFPTADLYGDVWIRSNIFLSPRLFAQYWCKKEATPEEIEIFYKEEKKFNVRNKLQKL